MKILIIIDQEGCRGIDPKQNSYEMIELMKNQLREYIDTIPETYEIDVLDCHNNGLNVYTLIEEYPKIKFISQIWNYNIHKQYNYAVLIGFHSAQGTDSPFAHTFRNEIIETLLDSIPVGEVTLITKWLQSYHIPILFIHGEKALKQEVDSLNLKFISNDSDLKFSCDNYSQNLYIDNKKVSIQLISDIFLDVFPTKLFNIMGNKIIFKNIEDYMLNLSNISIFLNAARNYYLMLIRKLINNIKWSYSQSELLNIKDSKIDSILNNDTPFILNKKDLQYVLKRLKIKI